MAMAWSAARRQTRSAVRCPSCHEPVPLDVTRIRPDGGEPTIPCGGCGELVGVPVFGGDWETEVPDLDDAIDAESPALEDELPEPPEDDLPEEQPRAERRNPRRTKSAVVGCRTCGADVTLDAAAITLTWTHAALACAACGSEVRVRRSDAFRDVEGAIAWTFASYSLDDDADDIGEPVSEPRRITRLLRRKQTT